MSTSRRCPECSWPQWKPFWEARSPEHNNKIETSLRRAMHEQLLAATCSMRFGHRSTPVVNGSSYSMPRIVRMADNHRQLRLLAAASASARQGLIDPNIIAAHALRRKPLIEAASYAGTIKR
jgi:hypothetical protein